MKRSDTYPTRVIRSQSFLDQLKQLHMRKSEGNWSPQSSMRVGVMHIAVGAALTLFFLAMRPDRWLWAIGVIPLFIGIGLVFVARTESRSRLNAVSPRSKNQDGDS
jgi:cadmium resistance protein CadD (predicted permease)